MRYIESTKNLITVGNSVGITLGTEAAKMGKGIRDEIVNESIRQYFMRVYVDYCSKADPNDMMKRMMEEVIS